MYHEQELIYLYHLGSQIAYELLFEKYRIIVEKYFMNNYIDTAETAKEDYAQIALLSFFKTLDSYRFDMNAKMSTYFSYIVAAAIRSSLRAIYAQKRVPYHKLVSLNDSQNIYLLEDDTLNDRMDTFRPDVQLRLKEDREYYQSAVDNGSSSFERKVFYYLVYGYSFNEIAKLLNVDVRRVYNAKYRLRKKMTKMK